MVNVVYWFFGVEKLWAGNTLNNFYVILISLKLILLFIKFIECAPCLARVRKTFDWRHLISHESKRKIPQRLTESDSNVWSSKSQSWKKIENDFVLKNEPWVARKLCQVIVRHYKILFRSNCHEFLCKYDDIFS